MYIRFFKMCIDVESPTRAHTYDAGLDFFMPKITLQYIRENLKSKFEHEDSEDGGYSIILPAHKNITIPSQIKIEIPPGFMGLFLNKSGIASKHELVIGAQVIDPYYSGEVHIDLHNIGEKPFYIKSNMKLAQMVIVPVVHAQPIEAADDDLYEDFQAKEYRGEDGFGSTDKVKL